MLRVPSRGGPQAALLFLSEAQRGLARGARSRLLPDLGAEPAVIVPADDPERRHVDLAERSVPVVVGLQRDDRILVGVLPHELARLLHQLVEGADAAVAPRAEGVEPVLVALLRVHD